MIVDANILTSALLGRSLPLLIECRLRGIALLMPTHQYAETQLVMARRSRMTADEIDQAAGTVIEVIPAQAYAQFEEAARQRLHPRGQPDWPVLAAAMAYTDEIWSNDRDLFGVGVAVWSTANIGFAEGVA